MQYGNALFFNVAHASMIIIIEADAMVIIVALIVQISTFRDNLPSHRSSLQMQCLSLP